MTNFDLVTKSPIDLANFVIENMDTSSLSQEEIIRKKEDIVNFLNHRVETNDEYYDYFEETFKHSLY